MNGRFIGTFLMAITISAVFALFVVSRVRNVRRLRNSHLLAVIHLGPEERRRFVWLDFARANTNLRWVGHMLISFTIWWLALYFYFDATGIRWTQGVEPDKYFAYIGMGGFGVWGLWLLVLLLRNWCVTKVIVYSEGLLLNGQPRLWGWNLKHVLFDEALGELRFYKEYETDDGGEFSKFIDVLRIPIAEGQKREARCIIESLPARKGASDWTPPIR